MPLMECRDCGRYFKGYSTERFCYFCWFHGACNNPKINQLEPKVIEE